MANRNGVAINSIPFEQRCPPPRRRKREPMPRADRMVLALCGSLLGLFLWTVGYMILASVAMRAEAKVAVRQGAAAMALHRDSMSLLPPYWWGACPAIVFATYGSIVGAERMMDGFEAISKLLGKFAEEANRQRC